ncbi:heme ABC transporter substrate-binding protein IsdE [Lactobacillus alvi]|uniref:High-affinity heme uptake system protein IsdE n=1 Tax=Limosilactobacillus alvi TaxID=990412 RepID=A0ABS2ELV1_9LACO|nr:heme ABC transporter substrate-binding protein IsdE [Limosilactobacillus alvi]MBM6753206.1 heme ABC transporter substrate-binding protein IsdE [Limosilactobacillus alvi]
MNSRKRLIIILVSLLVIIGGGAVAIRYFVNKQVAQSQRIVATTDAITEIFDKLDVDLVGVPTTSQKLPSRYKNVTHVGSPMSPSVEKIASLNPSKVYAVSTLKDQYSSSFKAQSVPVTYLKLDTVGQLKTTLKQLGKEYYRTRQANQQIKLINQAISQVKGRQHGRHPRVLVLMGMPGAGYLIATDHSYVGDLVRIAGGKNVYASKGQTYLSPSNETLATKHPDVILRLSHAMPSVTIPQFKKEFQTNPVWKNMPAVKNHRVYDLKQPTFNASANMEAPKALRQVSQWLYPNK